MKFSHEDFLEMTALHEFARSVDKAFSVSRHGFDYYLVRGTSPMDYIQLMHVRAFLPMTHSWAMGQIRKALEDVKAA